VKQTHVSRAGRKAQIVLAIFEHMATSVHGRTTAYQVAKEIGMAPSTHIRKMINELIDSGWINEQIVTDIFGRSARLIWLTNDAYKLASDMAAAGVNSWKVLKKEFEQ